MKTIVFALLSSILLASIAFAQGNAQISIDLAKNTTYVTQISSGVYLFSYTYVATSPTSLDLQVTLPPEYIIVDRNGLLVSGPFDITTDGRSITVIWKRTLNTGENFAAFVQYEGKSTGVSSFFWIIGIIAIGAVGAFAGYKLHSFRKEKFIKEVVSDDEKKVVEEIKKKGEILQEDLRDSLGWSKTKISKIVRNLEIKKVVEKIPYKKTNKLKLK